MKTIAGPFTIDVHVHVANDAEGQIGSACVSLAAGRVPTQEDLHWAAGVALAALPEGWRLLDGAEFFNRVLVRKKFGRDGNFAAPSDFGYDVAVLTAAGHAVAAARKEKEPEREDRAIVDEEEE